MLIAALASPVSASEKPAALAPILIEHVSVVPMDRERVLRDQTVLVEDGVITAIGKKVRRPEGAILIEGRGRYLLPGLADMHVHSATSRDMKLYLANGVTTVLNMGGASSAFVGQVVPKLNSGERPGPHVYLSLRVDGTPRYGQLVVATPTQARATVSLAKTNGYDFIKVYNNLTPETFSAFVDEGRREGLSVLGHGVTSVGIRPQLEAGQLMVAHLEEYLYTVFFPPDADVGNAAPPFAQIPDAVAFTKKAGAFVTADIASYAVIAAQWGRPDVVKAYLAAPEAKYLDPDDRIAWRYAGYDSRTGSLDGRLTFLRRFAKALADDGVPLLTGTDAPTLPGLVPGFSVVTNLRELERSGLTRFQALSAATRNPGQMILRAKPRERCFGTVTVGCRADLLLLDTNPLDSFDALERRQGVVVGGRWYDATRLNALLTEVQREYR